MNKFSLLAFGTLFLPLFAYGQSGHATISGKVTNKQDNTPVGWATVALMKPDSTIVAGVACDDKGAYKLSAAAGDYFLTASMMGYLTKSVPVNLKPGASEMPAISLEVDNATLAAAKVTGDVKLIDMKVDKLVMNVSQSAFAHGSNALDLIKKAPGVTVDKDGNVKLNGKAVSVWIDGRPSYMDGKSLEALLRSTNGESIDKFELMEHPSAKYDAQGQGGIINIKTKKNFLSGFNGSMGLGGGGMHFSEIGETPWQQSFWANLSYRTKKTNTFFNIYEGFYNTPTKIANDLDVPATEFHQTSNTLLLDLYHNYNVKFGNDWFINDKNTLGFIIYVPGSYTTMNSKSGDSRQWAAGQQTRETHSIIKNGPDRSVQHNINVNYTHTFDPQRSAEITANVDYYHNIGKNASTQVDSTVIFGEPEPVIGLKTMNTDNIYDIWSAKADYQTVVWKRYMLEAGGKWALSRTDNSGLETQTGVPDYITDFVYKEHVGALYASISGQPCKVFSFKAGLRAEYTYSFGDWKSSQTKTTRDYLDLFPTAYASWQPNEKWRVGLSYTRRINRPRYSQLNPAKVYIDSKTYILGNPALLPEYGNKLSLQTVLGQYVSWSVGYYNSLNLISQIPSYEPDGTQYLTWGNFGRQDAGIANFNLSAFPIAKWLQWTVSATAAYTNSVSDASGIARYGWFGQAYTDFTFLLPKDWKIDLDGYYCSPMVYGCYNIHSNWSSNLAVKKTLLDGRLTLTWKLEDIFRSSSTNLDIAEEALSGASTVLVQKYYSQKFLFDISWNFGKAQKPLRSRKVGGFEELSRVGGGSGAGK